MSFLKTKITSITKVFKREKHSTTYHEGSNECVEENTTNEMTATVFQVQDAPNEEKVGHSTEDIHRACKDDPFSAFSNINQAASSSSQTNPQQHGNPEFSNSETTAPNRKEKRASLSASDSSTEEIRTKELAPGISVTIESKTSRKKKRKSKMQRLEGIHRRTSQGLTPPSYLCSGCTVLSGLIMFISGMIMIILGLTVAYYQTSKSSGNFMRFGGGFFLMMGFLMMLMGGFYFLLVCLRHRGHFNKKDENKPPPAEVAESVTSDSESETEDTGITTIAERKSSNIGSTAVSMTSTDPPLNSSFSRINDNVFTSQRSGKLPPLSAPRSTLQHSNSRRPSMDTTGLRASQRDGSSSFGLAQNMMDKDQTGRYNGKRRASIAPVSSVSLTPRTLKKSSSAMEFEMSDIPAPYTPRGGSTTNLLPTGSTESGMDKSGIHGRRNSVQMYMRNK